MSNRETILNYPFIIRHLSENDGGGFLIEFPDLSGCISDGETIEETINNGVDAVQAWLAVAKEINKVIPKPGTFENQSGKWVQRVPRSIHLRLVEKAKAEGVSLNSLVTAIIAEALGNNKLTNAVGDS
jgi:antitoxin HicB